MEKKRKLSRVNVLGRESVGAVNLGEDFYRLAEVPLLFSSLNYGDVVKASEGKTVLAIREMSGHSKTVVRFRDGVEEQNVQTLARGLKDTVVEKVWGCSERLMGLLVLSHPHHHKAVKRMFAELLPDTVVTDGRELGMQDTFQRTRKFGELGAELQRQLSESYTPR